MAFSGLTAAAVPPNRLRQLSQGMNADNIVNNFRYANYTLADLRKLRVMGFTYLRIPIDPSFIMEGLPVNGQLALSDATRAALGLKRLDRAMERFVGAGFAVTLVLQPQTKFTALTDSQTEQFILQGVALLAQRYAAAYSPNQLTFELLNEPHYDPVTWNSFAPAIVATIRQYAPAHTIIVPSAGWDLPENFAFLTPIADANVIYTMHVYDPVELTFQGTSQVIPMPSYRFPKRFGFMAPTEWTSERLVEYMHLGINWATAHGVPLIMNEFGATNVANRASRMNWIKLVRQTAEANQVGWAWWSFDGKLFGLRPHGIEWDPDLVQLLGR